MRLGHRARLLGQPAGPTPDQMLEGYALAYAEWVRRRAENHPVGEARRAPVAALVLDVDEARLLLDALDDPPHGKLDNRFQELVRYLRHFHSELEKHRG